MSRHLRARCTISCKQRKTCFDRHAGLGKSDRNHGFREIGALAHAKWLAIQGRLAAFLRRPDFFTHRIVNYPDDDFALEAQRNRNAEMRNAVEIIHGAIERIDDPLMIAFLIAHNSFFAIKRVLGKFLQRAIR